MFDTSRGRGVGVWSRGRDPFAPSPISPRFRLFCISSLTLAVLDMVIVRLLLFLFDLLLAALSGSIPDGRLSSSFRRKRTGFPVKHGMTDRMAHDAINKSWPK